MLLDRRDARPAAAGGGGRRAAGDERFKLELPAAQLELSLPPARTVPEAIAALGAARRDLAAAAAPVGRLAAAGVHPFADPIGVLNDGERYAQTAHEYGSIARRQLVCALQVHVAVGGADRSLAVYNGLRPWLPLVAALAANAPFHDGRDTGLASIRPKIAEQLPRQGIPPAIASWESFADALAWGAASGAVPDARRWWWELRPHPAFGTLELRVPDAQATVADAAAVLALVHALAGWLAERHDAGEPLETADTWRLEENRWSAARSGMDAELADLRRARARPRASASPRCSPSSRRSQPSWAARRSSRRSRGWATQRRRAPARGGRARRTRARCRLARRRVRARPRVRDARGGNTDRAMNALPAPRGHTTEALLAALREPPHHLPPIPLPDGADPLADEDLQLALYLCYELHYRGLPASTSAGSGRPRCSRCARCSRSASRRRCRRRRARGPVPAPEEFDSRCGRSPPPTTAPSLSRHVERAATLDQVLEFLVHRSAYQLKEADPHSWAIPRLSGPPKAALVEIQADEYGGGRPSGCTPGCSPTRWRRSGSTPATAPTSTSCPRRRSRRST